MIAENDAVLQLQYYRPEGQPEAPDVVAWVFCLRCSEQLQPGLAAVTSARLSVGVTAAGDLVVWCERHRCLVARYRNDAAAGALRALAERVRQ